MRIAVPDITKCSGSFLAESGDRQCPYANACYRYTAKPAVQQSYMMHGPYSSKNPIGCDEFWLDRRLRFSETDQATIFARYISLIIMDNVSKIEYDDARVTIL
jgi:hypothetical protein